MQIERYTVKSQEALERAQRLAREREHQELEPEHLLAALLQEAEGTVAAVLSKLGVPRERLLAELEPLLGQLPRVRGGSMYLGERLRGVLDRAEEHAGRLKDEYISVEHLLLALADKASEGTLSACSRNPASRRRRCSRRSPPCAAASASPTLPPRTSTRRSPATAAISPPPRARASSIR
jgi:ATP-dependent Clp protease ATP-binding subunit ClpA